MTGSLACSQAPWVCSVHWFCAGAIIVSMTLALIRALRGPTVFDRALGVNMFGTKTVLLIAVTGFLFGRPEWLDLAIVYAMVNFVGTFALLRFAKFKSFAPVDSDDPGRRQKESLTDG